MAVYRFGPFELNSESGELTRVGSRVRLRPQPCAVLLHLLQNAGAFVSRADLHRQLWPEGTFVDFDQGLNSCIKQVRAALGDSGRHPRCIETLSRRGYRFLLPVSEAYQDAGTSAGKSVGIAVETFRAVGESAPLRSLAEGLREEVMTHLGRARATRHAVVVRSGESGPADFVLCCSVRASATRFRVVARLIQPSTHTHVWAAGFDGAFDDPIGSELEIARALVHDVQDVVTRIGESAGQGGDPPVGNFRTIQFKDRAS